MTQRNVTRLALTALAVLAALALMAPSWPGARLAVSTGAVEIGRGEPPVWKVAAAGETLGTGDRVRTGADGRAEVVLDGAATLRVYPNSVLRLPETTRNVEMERGSSLFDVLHTGEPFEVRTPEVVVSVKGTRFGVALDGGDAAVSVFRGLVGVHHDVTGAPETLVYAGFAARGSDQFELSWHGAADDAWEAWGHGGNLPDAARGARREAALRDAHQLAVLSARDLPKSEKGEKANKGAHDRANGGGKDAPPAAHDPDAQGGVVRDIVADAQVNGEDSRLDDVLEQSFVGNVIDQISGGLLTMNFVDGSGGSGSDRVELTDSTNTWVFQENELEDIVDGDSSLPTNLAQVLNQQGINDAQLVNQLLALFR